MHHILNLSFRRKERELVLQDLQSSLHNSSENSCDAAPIPQPTHYSTTLLTSLIPPGSLLALLALRLGVVRYLINRKVSYHTVNFSWCFYQALHLCQLWKVCMLSFGWAIELLWLIFLTTSPDSSCHQPQHHMVQNIWKAPRG